MQKKTKVIISILVIIIIMVGFFLVYTLLNKNTYNASSNQVITNNIGNSTKNELNNNDDENIIKNEVNTINNMVDNKVDNNNKIENNTANNIVENKIENENSEIQEKTDEEKAIEIVKKDYGNNANVSFKIEQINPNGTYVIRVMDAETSLVLQWYTVDPKTGKFTK